jgi:hypothetical protein
MGTSLATLASRPGRRSAATLTLLLFLLVGCAADAGTPAQPVEGLLVLTKGDVANLAVLAARRDPSKTVAIGLPLPANDMTWISAGSEGVILGSTADGAVATSDAVDPRGSAADIAGLEWKPVEATDESGAGLPPARFATRAPGGARFAAIGGDLAGGGDASVLLVDPKAGTYTTIALDRPLLSGPPVWLDDDRLALVTGSPSDPATIIVTASDGKVGKGPAGERRLATSVDGSVIATAAGAGAPVVLRSTKGWLADDGTSIGSVEVPDGFTEAVALALDSTGDRLAIVWRAEDGTARSDVHDGTDGWRRVWSEPVRGTAAAAVGWLR